MNSRFDSIRRPCARARSSHCWSLRSGGDGAVYRISANRTAARRLARDGIAAHLLGDTLIRAEKPRSSIMPTPKSDRFSLVGIPIERRNTRCAGEGWLAGRDRDELSKAAWELSLRPSSINSMRISRERANYCAAGME